MTYRAYGLRITSEVPLADLPEIDSTQPAEVTIVCAGAVSATRCDWFHDVADHEGEPWLRSGRTDGGFVLRFVDQLDVAVDAAGATVSLGPNDLDELEIRRLLLDHVLPRLLNLRGVEALHATAVDSPAGVCAFVGPTGTGKSTLAYSACAAGWPAVADDCLALRLDHDAVLAVPGYPVFRLNDDVVAGLGLEALEGVDTSGGKHRVVPAADQRVADERRLHRIYELERAPHPDAPVRVMPLAGAAALMALTTHAFRLDIRDRAMLERQMKRLSQVAERVRIARLSYPTSLDALGVVHETLRADIERQDAGEG